MRKISRLTLIPLMLVPVVAGCDSPRERPASEDAVEDLRQPMAAESMDSAGRAPPPPSIGPTAAPGVAFNYRYDFRMDAARIGAVQEKHAAACEALGVDRCRITGMSYRLVNDRDIAGMLAFKLEPGLARQFGKTGIAAVNEAEGMLVRSEISGTDAGSAISAATRSEGRLSQERSRLEAELKGLKANDPRRGEIGSRLEEIQRSIESTRTSRDENRDSLATTPMVFNYGSGDVVPGFDARSPLRDAVRTAGQTFIGAIAAFIVVLGALLPIALLIGLVILLLIPLRRVLRRWRPAGDTNPPPAPIPTAEA
jgi:hypothetical protein